MTTDENIRLADLLFGDEDLKSPEEYEAIYPYRDVKGEVTRLAPSPTGFIHLGNLYSALADERIAHSRGGVFYLRIEDTDAKRKVEGAAEYVIEALRYFDIEFDEGVGVTCSKNSYGPYVQSQRRSIYHTYAKKLVAEGRAYPCFCTEDDIEKIRAGQQQAGELTGYYGKYAVCRDLPFDEIESRLKAKEEYVIRLKSCGEAGREAEFNDEIRGKIKVSENIHDVVILKKDGIPTYHFAHVVDDHLMRTSLVVRGSEWLASLPIHIELFSALGFKPPKYAHTAHMMKIDEETGGKRKLSKRNDPEMSLSFYKEEGFHPLCIKVYLMSLLNSNFEEWRRQNKNKSINDFPFSVKHMNNSGALFDMDKLIDICKNELSELTVVELYNFLADWAGEYAPEKKKIWFADEGKFTDILMLFMGIGAKRRRKDLINAKQAFEEFAFFYDEFELKREPYFEEGGQISKEDVIAVLESYTDTFNYDDDSTVWFEKLGAVAQKTGFAPNRKVYKESPDTYKGDVSAVAGIVRVAVTGRANTPDLWSIIQIMGEEQSTQRVSDAIEELKA